MLVERAFKMPFAFRGLGRLVLGAVLGVVPVVNLVSLGYAAEVMERGVRGQSDLPSWSEPGAKFARGLGWMLVIVAYLGIPALVTTFGGLWGTVAATTSASGLNPFALAGLGGNLLWAVGLAMALGFVLPMALAHYAATGDIAAAFRLGTLIRHIVRNPAGYLGAYVSAIFLFFAVSLLAHLPTVGPPLVVLGAFYSTVILAAVFGGVYHRAQVAARRI
ncbi:MAG: DUF4013 domain-containing protein [Bacillota bacterium]|nr:DUF4013 domain-containing protein [Bacillota bacterium]